VAFELDVLVLLYSLIYGCIKEIKRWYCVGIKPENDGQG